MSSFDTVLKEAERLLGRSWAQARREALRLGGMGLDVDVDDDMILIRGARDQDHAEDARLYSDGRVVSVSLYQWGDGPWKNDDVVKAISPDTARNIVGRILKDQIDGMERGAARLQSATEKMASIS